MIKCLNTQIGFITFTSHSRQSLTCFISFSLFINCKLKTRFSILFIFDLNFSTKFSISSEPFSKTSKYGIACKFLSSNTLSNS